MASVHRFPATQELLGIFQLQTPPLDTFHRNGSSSFKNNGSYLEQSMEFDDDGGPPLWFSPLESGSRLTGSPLLLFLPAGFSINGACTFLQQIKHHYQQERVIDLAASCKIASLIRLLAMAILCSRSKFDLAAAISNAFVLSSWSNHRLTSQISCHLLLLSSSQYVNHSDGWMWVWILWLSTVGGKVVRGLGGIPSEGPVLLVSNHMLLGLDIAPLLYRCRVEQDINIRAISHPGFFEMEHGILQDSLLFDVVKRSGGVPVSAKNLYRLFASNSHFLLYPGGAREALHRRGEEYRLFWPDESEFVSMAERFGTKIVPFGTVGEDIFFKSTICWKFGFLTK